MDDGVATLIWALRLVARIETTPHSCRDYVGSGERFAPARRQSLNESAVRANESAPNSFESWDAKSNSPPPKSAHNQLNS
jgi:hypothetical protein